MTDHEKLVSENEEEEYAEVFTLTDEETGKEEQFELLASAEIDGKLYYAMASVESEAEEYVVLEVTEEGEEVTLSTVDDDETFDRVAEYFDNLLFGEIDYDAEGANEK